MRKLVKLLVGLVMFGMASQFGHAAGQKDDAAVTKTPAIPEGKETDVKFYVPDGGIVIGREALVGDCNRQRSWASACHWGHQDRNAEIEGLAKCDGTRDSGMIRHVGQIYTKRASKREQNTACRDVRFGQ